MRKWILLLSILLLVVPTAYGQGGDPARLTVDWLLSQQSENGSFGDEIGATSLAVIAQATLGETNEAALTWLESSVATEEELSLDEASLMVIALVSTQTDTSAFADGALLATYTDLLRSERGQDIDGLCMGLIARQVLGLALPPQAVDVLVGSQSEDGGFAAVPDSESDVVTTSLCVQVLAVTEQVDSLGLALDYLSSAQLDDDGWALDATATESDPLATAFVVQALTAADEVLADWDHPDRALLKSLDFETGAILFGDGENTFMNIVSTATAAPIFRGQNLIGFATSGEAEVEVTSSDEVGPPLGADWALVASGFGMSELNTADDFFVTVIDPFTNDELYGIEIINWTAEYQYTGYIVQQYLSGEALLWMAERDSTIWDNISLVTLQKLTPEELAKLPAEIQARVTE
ncbi:MAG: terpene cyclase/mutase family protein [Anaerolineales bacterium]|nr:terpene cyclase/mutase family protein [Anaerolineales bacterium]